MRYGQLQLSEIRFVGFAMEPSCAGHSGWQRSYPIRSASTAILSFCTHTVIQQRSPRLKHAAAEGNLRCKLGAAIERKTCRLLTSLRPSILTHFEVSTLYCKSARGDPIDRNRSSASTEPTQRGVRGQRTITGRNLGDNSPAKCHATPGPAMTCRRRRRRKLRTVAS
jgi:hypothetical protein